MAYRKPKPPHLPIEWESAVVEGIFVTAQKKEYLTIFDVCPSLPTGWSTYERRVLEIFKEAEGNEWIEEVAPIEPEIPPYGEGIEVKPWVCKIDEEEVPRLTRHCAIMLSLLARGPVTNAEMRSISLNHTARISDLRDNGFPIEITHTNRQTGIRVYELVPILRWRSLLFGDADLI